jgi:hypothetical protein
MAKGGGVLELIFGGGGKGSDEPEADPCAEIAEEMMAAFKERDVDALADALRAFKDQLAASSKKKPSKSMPDEGDDEDEEW